MKWIMAVSAVLILPLYGFAQDTGKKMNLGPDGHSEVVNQDTQKNHQDLQKKFDGSGEEGGGTVLTDSETGQRDNSVYIPERKYPYNPTPKVKEDKKDEGGASFWDIVSAPFSWFFSTKLWIPMAIGGIIGLAFGGLGGAMTGAVVGLGIGVIFLLLKELIS